MTNAPIIGDDVVDLADPVTATAHLRPRYVARVCSVDEVERVNASNDPSTLLWSLFAAKEAAFKAISKVRPGAVFAHRQFEVSDDLRFVRYRDLTLRVTIRSYDDCVHAVAVLGHSEGEAFGDVVFGVERVALDADLSVEARRLLSTSLAPHLDCDADDLYVYREPIPGSWSGFGPPILRRAGSPTSRDISLSHDGRFVSFAAVQRPQP